MNSQYLSGLNTLRFFAAFFVIISHASINSFCDFDKEPYGFLNRGGDAVEFFFTLSGFLITYLLIQENDKTQTISIKKFYLRRVFRIWPLYFLVVFAGFILFAGIYPRIYHQPYFTFPLITGLLSFIFFLPNYITSSYSTGLLHPLWSIGVEEQFYLFWAPLFKASRKHLLGMILFFIIVSSLFYGFVSEGGLIADEGIKKFLLTQRFYAMGIGSLFGYVLFYHRDWYVRSVLSNKIVQFVVMGIICTHYMLNIWFTYNFYFHAFISVLYGLLILNVSTVDNKLVNIEKQPFVYLGVISYGLYMYHMFIDYALRFIFPVLVRFHISKYVLIPFYYIVLLALTIMVAGLSHKYMESYFLKLKGKYAN